MHSKLVTATAFSLLLAVSGAMAQSTGSGGSGAGEAGTIGGNASTNSNNNSTISPDAGTGSAGGTVQPLDPNTTGSTTNNMTKGRDCTDPNNNEANANTGSTTTNPDANSAVDNNCR